MADVCKDLATDRPMQRLVQADVGAGKTAVAVYALLVAVANKQQAILMAPTEVLARQHWLTLEKYLANSRVRRLLLTGGRRRASAATHWKRSAAATSISSSARRRWCKTTCSSPAWAWSSSTSSIVSASTSGPASAGSASIRIIS